MELSSEKIYLYNELSEASKTSLLCMFSLIESILCNGGPINAFKRDVSSDGVGILGQRTSEEDLTSAI